MRRPGKNDLGAAAVTATLVEEEQGHRNRPSLISSFRFTLEMSAASSILQAVVFNSI